MTTAPSQASPEIECSGLSHIGSVREDNQDAIRLSGETPAADRRLFAHGRWHGRLLAWRHRQPDSRSKHFSKHSTAIPTALVPRRLRRGVDAANLGVYQMAQRLGAVRMGTTLTAVTVVGQQLHLAHVGDSRAYLIRDNRAQCLTNDHTHVGDMVRMKVIPPDKVRTHAQRSILTKGLGLTLFVQPDITQVALQDGDRWSCAATACGRSLRIRNLRRLAASATDMTRPESNADRSGAGSSKRR